MKSFLKIFLNRKFIIALIIINAVVIFLQEFPGAPSFFDYLDNVFTIIFTVELIVKIRAYTFTSYWRSNWNKFDFILVFIALFGFALEILNIGHPISLEYVLSLRVLRLFKSFRLIQFVPDISNILSGINRAVKTSGIIVLAFSILLFIVSVLSCLIFKNIAPEYFNNPLQSLYTIFRIFSIEGWYEIPDLIAERTSVMAAFLTKLYFTLLLFIGGILGMSLINSIFVDAMVSDNNEELENEVRELNHKIDKLINEINNMKSGND